ncbi:MAG: PHP domain-containing protein [Bacteroidota bacterium]
MTNKEIANKFQELANLMELHEENKFKIRSYANAYITLRKLGDPLVEMSDEEMIGIKGVGKSVAAKIRELLNHGEMAATKKYTSQTPPGVVEMLKIKGFGPKKIRVIWKELGAESVGELLYACNENRLIELKGFGLKTQEDLIQKIEYFLTSRNKFHYARLEQDANVLLEKIQTQLGDVEVSLVGEMRRRCPIVNVIEILIGTDQPIDAIFADESLQLEEQHNNQYTARTANEKPVIIYTCPPAAFGSKLFRYSSSDEFLKAFIQQNEGVDFKGLAFENDIFEKANLPFVVPELRESADILELAKKDQLPELVEEKDIKGVIHSHSTYSDGINSLKEMAEYSKALGYQYLGITDHSKSAFYANGLKEDRLLQQFAEIDELNKALAPFKIFKGIESDILNDGALDYPTDILRQFDFIIASVHSNLKMDKDKATTRLLKAIENRYTTILGHPTGRLLLSRKGYPIDHKKIIDACAANQVAIELNANPYRLDLDWTWIPYALEKGVLISVNPDAHSTQGIHDIHFGTLAARKGRLTKEMCLNARDLEGFKAFVSI